MSDTNHHPGFEIRRATEDRRGKGGPTPPQSPGPNGPNEPGRKQSPSPLPTSRGLFGLIAVLLLVLLGFMLISTPGGGKVITLDEFRTLYESQQIERDSVMIRNDSVQASKKAGPDSNGRPETVRIPLNTIGGQEVTKQVMEITSQRATLKPESPALVFAWIFGSMLLFIFITWWLLSRMVRNAGGGGGMLGSFGKSRHRMFTKENTGITFADVAGIDEAKEEVGEIIEFLKNPKKFQRLGGRIPRGVLLTGPPGVGKTLLAKAIAGEAEVPFFSISGSDFVEMFVGVGASRVRDLFKQAKDNSPCIIFLDEIDAVGRRRGGGFTTGGHDEREQTLNAILVEMDGFTPADGVIVIAATNRSDVLDPALIRPGRFDRQINVPLPDVKGRLEILKVHAKRVKLADDVDLERTARITPMFSGADLAAIINEAAISATMTNKDAVHQLDLEEARDKVRFGRAKKSRVREKDENRLVAYHEAGHAVLQALLKDGDPLHKVTIIPRGNAGGATFAMPEKDRTGYGLKWLIATMRMTCGGRIAEERAVGDVSSGAMGDISQVTNIARTMVLEWGMSDRLGFVRYTGVDTADMYVPEKQYSEETARIIDEEIRRLVDDAYADAKALLEKNWEKVVAVAEALLKYETLSAEDVEKLMSGGSIDRPTVGDGLSGPTEPRKRPDLPIQPEPELPPGAMPSPA